MRELLSNNLLFVGQLCTDNSLLLHARDLIFLNPEFKINPENFPPCNTNR